MLPITLLAIERREIYYHLKNNNTKQRKREIRKDLRIDSLDKWQIHWNMSTKARWTHRLIPILHNWIYRKHGDVDFYITKFLTGNGCFQSYLHKFKLADNPNCPNCEGRIEDAEHIFFSCTRFTDDRCDLYNNINTHLTPDNLIDTMLIKIENWNLIKEYCTKLIKDLRKLEKIRIENENP